MIRSLVTSIALISCAAPAVAQETGSNWEFALGAATDNRSKDASKSEGNPSVWGEALWVSSSGLFYAGPGFETIKSSTGSKLEVQAVAGIRPEIAGFDVDLKAAFKQQIDADRGTDDDAWEFTANLSRSIGPASARLQVQHSPDGTGTVKSWTWVETRLGWDLTNSLTATAAVGRREQNNAPDYTGWNAGLNWQIRRGLDADLRWYDTNADVPGEQYAGALVAAVSFAF